MLLVGPPGIQDTGRARPRTRGTDIPGTFPPVTDRALAKVQQQTRRRVLKWFKRRELLPADAVETMQDWEHGGGLSLNAEVWVLSWDRAGLEPHIR